MSQPVVEVSHLTHAYNTRKALDDLTLSIDKAEVFGFLGPNGSGKTTLFRILATLIPPPSGVIKILGVDPSQDRDFVRARIGVVFQSPSLDKQLTARENLQHQGHLYGLRGKELKARVDQALQTVALGDRAAEPVERFSGGMRRRVEVAKGLLHHPQILLLDEPSTGLDPAARIDLWQHLKSINRQTGVTILVTTHLMEEADRCSRLAVMAKGKLLATDTPALLKDQIGGDVITLTTAQPELLQKLLSEKLQLDAKIIDSALRIERPRGHEAVPSLIEAAPGLVDSVSVGKPTLEDVFIRLTGHRLRDEAMLASAD